MEKMIRNTPSSASNYAASIIKKPKTERKVIEKNRRIHMKSLYSQLFSLLPSSHASSDQEAIPLIDQIDKAIDYIKELKEKVEKSKKKKESLSNVNNNITGNKRSLASCYESNSSLKPPQLEIRETGSNLEIVLISGVEHNFLFYEIIRIVNDEGLEVVNANFSTIGNSVFHVIIHAEITKELYASGFGAVKVIERLKKFVNGSTSEAELLEPHLWDFDTIRSLMWDF